jgi:hypothetical protein
MAANNSNPPVVPFIWKAAGADGAEPPAHPRFCYLVPGGPTPLFPIPSGPIPVRTGRVM